MKISGGELYNALVALLDGFTKQEAIHRLCSFMSEDQYRQIIQHLLDTSKLEKDIVHNSVPVIQSEEEKTCSCNCNGTCHSQEEKVCIGDYITQSVSVEDLAKAAEQGTPIIDNNPSVTTEQAVQQKNYIQFVDSGRLNKIQSLEQDVKTETVEEFLYKLPKEQFDSLYETLKV